MSAQPDLLEPIDCELVIGCVGAIGTQFQEVIQKIESHLKLAGYDVEVIKVSRDVISEIVTVQGHSNDYERYSSFMHAGNEARRLSKRWTKKGLVPGNNAILAMGVAARIFERSLDTSDAPEKEISRPPRFKRAYIVDSLKRKEEVETLRSIYGDGFVLVGVHESEERRIRNLSGQSKMTTDNARALIIQRVNETFHLADFFVEICEERTDLECSIRRLVEIWFGHPFRTPTFDEYAMYMAHCAALRSADLSRQVGAVLARRNLILSTGANECPKPQGGQYWAGREFDSDCMNDVENGRDYLRGIDSNRAAQIELIDSIVAMFHNDTSSVAAVEMRSKLDQSAIKDITEYGRVVHAEMEALLACGRLGVSTQDATLYCTTFPCHNCAKHIIAAGVTKVVYIEPYPKSRALAHHSDAISEDEEDNRVQFVPFTGVGPRRFYDLFSMDGSGSYRIERKKRSTGKALEWKLQESRLRIQMRAFTYLEAETQAARLFKTWIPKGGKDND
jgi:deoxycytidylate deaminase